MKHELAIFIAVYLTGVAHALPAYFFGRAAGVRWARELLFGKEDTHHGR